MSYTYRHSICISFGRLEISEHPKVYISFGRLEISTHPKVSISALVDLKFQAYEAYCINAKEDAYLAMNF